MVSFEEETYAEPDGFATLRIHQMIEEVLAELRGRDADSGTIRESFRDTFVEL
ncbi:MAG: hypothetical protein JNK04_26395 [Myxococcales bacterium]|nr:hypothetical protein [Myxococcales bacterium]